MADDNDWKSLGTMDKMEHKNWKARVEGYDSALKDMKKANDSKDAVFQPYLCMMKKMVIDSNAAAQEKALEVVEYFCAEAHIANKAASEICPGVITKCLNSVRPKTKEKGIEVLKLLIEAEKHDVVIDELLKGLSQKAPKVIVGCIIVLKEALHEFGPKIVPIKELFKQIPKLLEDRDKGVRESGKELIVEIYCWIGKPALEPLLSQLKPVQVTELTNDFENIESKKPVPTRYLKSQKPKTVPGTQPAAAQGENIPAAVTNVSNRPEIDPYDLVDPVEVIKKIPANYYDNLEEKKWTTRKEALEAVDNLTNHPKLLPGEYADLIKSLIKVVSKDSNVVLATLAAKILKQIAIGLRKRFSPYALETLKACFDKFKEKKLTVVTTLRECVDATYLSTSLDNCIEDIHNALSHKTPNVRTEVSLFLNRIFEKSNTELLPKKHLKVLATDLSQLCLDSTPDVREAAFQALGTAMLVVTEKNIKPFIENLDNVKVARIMEFYEKAKEKKAQENAPKVAAATPAKPVDTKTTVVTNTTVTVGNKGGGERKPPAGKSKPLTNKKPAAAKLTKDPTAAVKKGPNVPTENIMTDDDAILKAGDTFGDSFVGQLTDKNYKERLIAMETLQKYVRNTASDDIPCQLIVKLLMQKPGLKDNNIQVLKAKIELIKEMLLKGKMSWTAAEMCIPDLTDKIGDIKNSVCVKSTLTEMSDLLDVSLVSEQVIKTASDNVNLKNIIESLNWVNDAITDFGFKIPLEKMLPFIKICLGHTSPLVRQAAIRLIGTISLYIRDKISVMLNEEKASIKQLIDAEVSKMKDAFPTPPTRGIRNSITVEEIVSENEGGPTKPSNTRPDGIGLVEIDPEQYIVRENVSGRITEALLEKLAEKSWKIKKEAFDTINEIFKSSPGVKGDGLQNLLAAVAKNTGDNSAVISKLALACLSDICKLLQKKDAEKFVRVVVPGIMSSCSDAKPKNREDGINTLNCWTEKVGFAAVADGGMVAEAIKVDSPYQKASVLTWMTPYLKQFGEDKLLKKTLYSDFGNEVMPPFFSCLEERSPEVRKAAQECLVPLMMVVGHDKMVKYHEANTKLASKDTIKQYLEKAREQLPDTKTSAASGAKTTASSSTKKESSEKKPTGESKPKAKEDGKKNSIAKSKGKSKPSQSSIAPLPAEQLGSLLLSKSSNKRQRIMEDKKKKLTRWETNSYNLQILETQFQPNCSPDLHALLFAKDFKLHNKAIDMMSNFISENDDITIEATRQNLDIILKWMVFRFNETNPSVVNRGLDYLIKVFNILTSDESFNLHEQEAVSFIPDLSLKLGDSKDVVRANARKLMSLVLNCYSEIKLSQFLEDNLESKVARVRQESADFLREMIDDRRIDAYGQKTMLKLMSTLISERDNGVRTAALNCLVSAHNFMGEDLMTLLKNLSQKDTDMLLERIKRTGKPVNDSGETISQLTTTSSSNAAGASGDRPSSRPSKLRDSTPLKESGLTKPQSQVTPAAQQPNVDINPLLQEDITHKLINLDKDIEELNQPLEKIELHFAKFNSKSLIDKLHSFVGRSNQTVNSNEAIRAVINDINDSDIEKSILAMAQIDEVVRHEDMYGHLKPHMDKLVSSISMHMKATLGKLSDDRFNESEVTDMFRGMLATLASVFNAKELSQTVSRIGLMELMSILLQIVLNDQLVALADGATIVRCINVLSVRILDSANQTWMLTALIRMMSECLKRGDFNSKYLYLIYKCIWSMTKNLVNTIKIIDLSVIMKDINTFFLDFPPSTWESAVKDVPLRTIKTLVHSLISNNNGGILEVLYRIPNTPGNELDGYIRKSYSKLNLQIPIVLPTASEIQSDLYEEPNPNTVVGSINIVGGDTQSQYLLKDKHSHLQSNKRPYMEELKQIFRKIGMPNEKEQGLNDLYDFKVKYPYVDLDRYLCQTSSYFQKIIETGLKEIANKRCYSSNNSNSNNRQSNNSGATNVSIENDPWAYSSMDPDSLFKRLKVLRQSVGLDKNMPLNSHFSSSHINSANDNKTSNTNGNNKEVGEMENSFMARLDTGPRGDGPTVTSNTSANKQIRMSEQDIQQFRERMAALKKNLN